ncbi:MAG: helix-turn-helix domain-containing protein [Candidatus Kapaibacterium sp.]
MNHQNRSDTFFGIADQLPDPSSTLMNWDAPCPEIGWPNMVTNAIASSVRFPQHHGPLSIKCAFNGTETYNVGRTSFKVNDRSYLILNDGQRYESSIDEFGANSFCIFFRPGFPEEVLRNVISPDDHLLDNPVDQRSQSAAAFFEKLYSHDRIISPILLALHRKSYSGSVNKMWLAEQFHALLDGMLRVHRNISREIDCLTAVKRSTRVECYRRLQRAKEYIDAYYSAALTIPEIASAACLSTHHFLRTFKQVFGMTPYRYITHRRMEEARNLLLKTDLPVSAICYDIGFESPGSFSSLFRQQTGMSPAAYRADHRRGLRPS